MNAKRRGGEGARGRGGELKRPLAPSPSRPLTPSRVPASTYRVQLNANFTFRDALAIVAHLQELGISDLYCSPIFKARTGSQHGYDVVDSTTLNPELGTRDEFDRLVAELRRRGMGLLLDIVPNHMATGGENRWWLDVLQNGPESKYARFFDIDWLSSYGKPNLENKVLIPILGKPYGDALAQGELKLVFEDDVLWVRYFDDRFPLARSTWNLIGKRDLERINEDIDEIDRILEEQYFRLAFWGLASEELNYRRFFDIGELIGVRVEDEAVFQTTHRLVDELIRSGNVTGLRIDHIDGLHDPIHYLNRVQHLGTEDRNYVVVEKILDASERLPDEMDVEGTTGYDFLNLVNSVFVDRDGVDSLREIYRQFTGTYEDFAAIVYRRKRRAVARLFAGEVGRLSRRLASIAARDRVARDIPLTILVQALIDITSSLPVYRTYTNSPIVSQRDREFIDAAVARARELSGDERRVPAYEFLRRLLILDSPPDEEVTAQWLRFVMQWQQLTGPAMAKGFEDTALYVYHPLSSLNEVGGDPEFHAQSTGVEAFHRRNAEFLRRWPHSMNATTTHDTKRSEGARARLNVLSEIPAEWRRRVRRWRSWNEPRKLERIPDRNEEMLIYQGLLGSWPLHRSEVPEFRKRFREYLVKATREAKTHSNWIAPVQDYEKRLIRFADAVTSLARSNRFLSDFLDFQSYLAFFGAMNSLSQVVLKCTAPGVPDFYQGSGLWDFSMVDPDNRRSIDYAMRARLLRQVARADADYRRFLREWRTGSVKLFVTHRTLHFRNQHQDLFLAGDYVALRASGIYAENVCAFLRRNGSDWSLSVVPRLTTRLTRPERFPVGAVWRNTLLKLPREAPRSWRNVLTGETVRSAALSEIFATFPVAVLSS